MEDSLQPLFAQVLLPLAIPQTYTYAVPITMKDQIQFGIRVEVPLRNKLYSGLVISTHNERPVTKTKNIISVLDTIPLINLQTAQFWEWMAGYYCAHLGEVMNVALPSGLKLASESRFMLNKGVSVDHLNLSDDEFLVTEAMTIQQELSVETIQDILDKKTVYPVIKSLMQKRVLYIKEELKQKYKPKQEEFITLKPPYNTDLDAALEKVERSEKQARTLLALMSLLKKSEYVSKKELYEKAGINRNVLNALSKKELIDIQLLDVSRIDLVDREEEYKLSPLSDIQVEALTAINEYFKKDMVTLLHGITGSGKTRLYIALILEVLQKGGQVLLMLPEIALTNQIVKRLEVQLGNQLFVYHSKINDYERVEIWQAAMNVSRLFIGARSALFLPFSNLDLIIVDEEHDVSYKQANPNPRYQGRDSAIMLGKIYGANVLLGTATPSLESMHNCRIGKYGYVQLSARFGEAVLPTIEIVDMKAAYKKGLVQEGFSKMLLENIEETVSRGEQVILFQNRRGYAPIQRCNFCAWTAECPNCDVTLTYHQIINDLKCHYCGYRQRYSDECPACGNHDLKMLGTGTQKIEKSLGELMPNLRIGRFDYDTTRSKGRQEEILNDFRLRKLDVLVGTQMITKGFDFEHISLVGIISVDGLLSYPDFRAAERSFQLLVQVSGRAGRRQRPGNVIIQAFKTDHPVLQDVLENRSESFYNRELKERSDYIFPPFYYLISITMKHHDLQKTKKGARVLSDQLKTHLGNRVQGPVDPPVMRVRNQYHQVVYIRIEKQQKVLVKVKRLILEVINRIKQDKTIRQVNYVIDVDPY